MHDPNFYSYASKSDQDWIDGVAVGFARALQARDDISYTYIESGDEGSRRFGYGMSYGYNRALDEMEEIFLSGGIGS